MHALRTSRRAVVLALVALASARCGGGGSDDDAAEGTGDQAPAGGRGGASAGGAGGAGTDGPGASAGDCGAPSGRYEARYERLDGTCGELATSDVALSNGTTVEIFAQLDVQTETRLDGCTLALMRATRDARGVLVEQLDAAALTVRADGTIVGMVALTRYDERGEEQCSGSYQATLTPRTLGGGAVPGTAGTSGESGEGGAGEGSGEATFSQQHAAEIEHDCTHSVQCFLQRDEQVEDDPFEQCKADSARALDADPQRQATFLANYERCKSFIVCDYYDCAVSGASGYGASQAARVQQRCQAESDCRAASGAPDPDPAYAVDSCEAFGTADLDVAGAAERTAWETAFLRCSSLSGCDFVDCFAMQ